MFSSKELISFVFVNENDIYYGDDLLKLDQDQYLWDLLHGSYDAVYFLSAEGSTFQVRTFGDVSCSEYTPGKKSLFSKWGGKTEQTVQGDWLLRQLRAKSGATAAFVCPLEDFCSVLSDDSWDETLDAIAGEKKRTGIFVLTASATAEQTKDLLLESPVFEKLHETAVTDLRGGELRELYGTIKKRKWDSCLFLNTFTWERVRALLLHVAMAYPQRCESCRQLDQLADYLSTYLREPELACDEPLFTSDLPADYLMYRELYEHLCQEWVWNRLQKQSERYARQENWLERRESAGTHVPVLRDRNSYAGKCMKVKLPQWVRTHEDEGPRADRLLQDIRGLVSTPKNRRENRQIANAAEDFLSRIDAVRDGDLDTYKQVLNALKFCIDRIYTDPEEQETVQIQKIIKNYCDSIAVSDQCFVLRRDLDIYRLQPAVGKLQSKTLAQLEAELRNGQKMRELYADLIGASVLELTMPSTVGNVSDILADLEQKLERYGQSDAEALPLPEPADEPDWEPQWEKEEEFILRPEDYSYIPPTY